MNLSALSTIQIAAIMAIIVVLAAGIAIALFVRKRRTQRLRTQFGGAEYTRAVKEGGSWQKAEAALDDRAERVERFHIRPLAPGDRTRFIESWARVQARFVDGPGGAVTDADQLLGDVMFTRGYPVSDFEQRAADLSVDHPLVLENYRAAHETALRQSRGQANTEDLRQAMIHYRTLFEELVGEPRRRVRRPLRRLGLKSRKHFGPQRTQETVMSTSLVGWEKLVDEETHAKVAIQQVVDVGGAPGIANTRPVASRAAELDTDRKRPARSCYSCSVERPVLRRNRSACSHRERFPQL